MSTRYESQAVKNLYTAYLEKDLRPETALEVASDFVLDLINVFGEKLNKESPLKADWCQFAPFEFILALNSILAKYKAADKEGFDILDDTERILLTDNQVLLATLINSAFTSHSDNFPEEEHFQIPRWVAEDLQKFIE